MPWRTDLSVVAAMLTTFLGCAFTDGQPWGRLDITLSAVFEPEPARLDEFGRLVTSRDYSIRLDAMEVLFDSVSVSVGPVDGSASGGFDPANPPPGYGLCHGGHCHADDGRLVSYEDIGAELGGSQASTLVVLDITGDASNLLGDEVSLELGNCPEDCEFQRGIIEKVAVLVTSVRLEGHVLDRLPEPNGRIPSEGFRFVAILELDHSFAGIVSVPVDRGHPVDIGLGVRFLPGPGMFDDLDWSDLQPDAGAHMNLRDSPEILAKLTARFLATARINVVVKD